MGLKLMFEAYSPGEVSSFIEIEEDYDSNYEQDEASKSQWTEQMTFNLQEKLNLMLKADVMNKMRVLTKEFVDNKKNLKKTLGGMDGN
jgi:hypothetical protein